MVKNYTFLFLLFFCLSAISQSFTLTGHAEISVLTLGPGNDALYDSFGHSAFRIKDSTQGIDKVYDYGRFDFNTPNFYLKFAQGKLLYQLGTSPALPFINYYKNQNRSVKEQVLDLDFSQKQELSIFLQNNILPENRDYRYDFFYDNCATRIREVLVKVLGDNLVYEDNYITDPSTFRDLIQENLNVNSWGSLGIDIALGAVIDRKATAWEHQFLPKYIFLALDHATLKEGTVSKPIVKDTHILYTPQVTPTNTHFLLSPLFFLMVIGMLIIFITYKDVQTKKRSHYLDLFLFLLTGIAGILLVFLWIGTDHTATANNYNLLWAFPLNAILIFALFKNKPWHKNYVFLLLLMLALMIVHGFSGVQVFPIVLIPLLVGLGVRYSFLFRFLKPKNKYL